KFPFSMFLAMFRIFFDRAELMKTSGAIHCSITNAVMCSIRVRTLGAENFTLCKQGEWTSIRSSRENLSRRFMGQVNPWKPRRARFPAEYSRRGPVIMGATAESKKVQKN